MTSKNVKEWRKNNKLKLVICMGSKCQICDYNKSINALEFHHLNPNDKEFSISSVRANPKNWEAIVNEMKKCILLCSNCHREVHDNITQIPKMFQVFDERLLEKEENNHLYKKSKPTYCPICNKQKENQNKTCSVSCGALLKNSIDWDSIDLIDLIENQKMSKNKIAELLNCSDVAVGKRYKKIKSKE